MNKIGILKVLTIINIVLSAIVTIFACSNIGIKFGIILGLLTFLLLGGLGIVLEIVTSPSKGEIEKLSQEEKLEYFEKTKNNPTLR